MNIRIENTSLFVNGNHLVTIPEWQIRSGELIGLSGETGCGKSTLGKWLACIEPVYWKQVTSEPKFDSITEQTKREHNDLYSFESTSVLYLLQDAFQIFNPYVSLLTHFKDVWKINSDGSWITSFDDIYQMLHDIGIHNPRDLMGRKVHQVSQGEAQRMAFVLGLIRPAYLRIYDEVFSNVDEQSSRSMLSCLSKYCRESETSAIIISHDIKLLKKYMDGNYQIRDGLFEQINLSSPHRTPEKPEVPHKPLIGIKALRVHSFTTTTEVLCHLPEFHLGRNENVGLFGESGVGKTTLLKGIMGEHRVSWADCDIFNSSEDVYSDKISDLDIRYLPQSVVSAFNPVHKLRTSFREIQSVRQIGKQEILRLMALFQLEHSHLDHYPRELSGGEIQRAGIISVLPGEPDVILLDESFSSVDETTRKSIWSALLAEQSRKSFSMVVVSHDKRWLQSHMNRLYGLEQFYK